MNSKFLKKIFFCGIGIGVLTSVALIVGYNSFYGSAIDEEKQFFVTPDMNYGDLTTNLKSEISSKLKQHAFDFYASHLDLEDRFKVGHYTLKQGMSVVKLVRMLVLGEQTPVNIVVGEARTMPQLASKLSKQIMADSTTIITALYDKKLRVEMGYVRDSLIAMFVPNTYQVYWTISPEKLLARLKRESDNFWNEERQSKLKQTRLSRYEAMTLASIVYEETKNRGEMPKIAGVYINRLRKNIALQACPTVKYAMGDFALTRILYKHLKYDSPFNTYKYAGLPPAPICIPSIAAIDAVLNYEKSDYLYFCAKPEFDGTHNFARTLSEHNANSRKYNEALARLKK